MGKETIKSIAKHFGISSAAVSKALNDMPDISSETKKKITDYAIEHNYVPDFFARGLKGARSKVVGVILADTSNPTYTDMLNAIGDVTDRESLSFILCNSKEDWRREIRHINVLIQKSVDGVLVVPSDCRGEEMPQARYRLLDLGKVPYVLLNRTIDGVDADAVKSDNRQLALNATKYLFEKGHTDIIHFTNNFAISTVSERIDGFRQAFSDAGRPFRDDNIIHSDGDYDSCYKNMLGLLSARNDFSAVFVYNDIMAFPIIKAIFSSGRRIPADIAVLGVDNTDFSADCLVPLTTVAQDNYRIGELASEILADKINGKAPPGAKNKVHLLPPLGIVERQSV